MSSMRVLITGANGFIGKSLRDYIAKKYPQWKVYGIDKKSRASGSDFRLGLEDRKALRKVIFKLKPRYVFHLSGDTMSRDLRSLVASNVYPTFTLCDVIKGIHNYKPRIIIPSSAAELSEHLSPYGFSKILQREVALMFVKEGLDIVIARIFNIIGRATPKSLSIGSFASQLALIKKGKKRAILNTRNLDVRRDFVDINDVCKYLIAVALYGERGQTYNICRGSSYSIRYLLNRLLNISGLRDIKIIENKRYDKEPESIDSFGSNRSLRKISANTDFIPIKESLTDTYRYYLSRS